jgi:RHS repeat-associated protein
MTSNSSAGAGTGPRRAGTACAAITALALVALPGVPGAHPGGGRTPAALRPAPKMKPVPVHAVPKHPVKVPVMRPWHRPATVWPSPGSASAAPAWSAGSAGVAGRATTGRAATANVTMAEASTGSARAGSLPVWVGPAVATSATGRRAAAASAAKAASEPSGSVRVSMAPRKTAVAAGISGVIFSVARSGSAGAGASVHVSLDYRAFAFADGGGYAARLHLVELPACVLTAPSRAACERQTPLASADDVTSFRLGANVTLPAGPASAPSRASASAAAGVGTSSAVVLGATTSTSGSAGDFTATPLSEAGTWTAGGASGAFTYTYPITVPPVPGGLAPEVSLGYNSQAVDGLTSSTNDQASWIGDGWDYEPGYIERDYQSCELNPAGSTKTGDECWSSNNITTLSLGGVTTTLVDDPTAGWHAEADNGDKITYETGGSNGTEDGGYWVVTDPDGTSYYFGLNELPGYASGDATTNSAWTVPVYATASGQPCYNATFADSHCEQAWRWNLDYVTDSHGDAMALYYDTETNYYAADNGTKATASYIQGGALSKIEYGLRAGSVYGVTPAAEVTFTTATDRTDIPTGSSADLACSSGASCDVISPTFWIKYRLTTIATESLEGSTLDPVDSWALAQDYPATGDGSAEPPMWLESITQTGEDASTHIALPPVSFYGCPSGTPADDCSGLPNRVETATDLNDGYSIIDRFRIEQVTSETGGVTTITYDTPPSSCTSGNFPAEDDNTTVCYPDYWTPPGASSPVEDWFNKYVVTAVTQSNSVGGTTPVTTTYCYGASPGCLSSGAWHYDDDALTRSKDRTWDQWRGFKTVTTETGTAPDPVTQTVDTYFQGMNGDYQGSGNPTTSASLTSSLGSETVTDSDQFAGMDFEHIVYDGAGSGDVVTDTVTVPWASAATATQSQPSPLPSLQAFMTGVGETKTFTALAAGGYRESDVTYAHDSDGRVTSVADVPDTSDASEDTCTQTTYAPNTTTNLIDLPAEKIVTDVPPSQCPISGAPTQAELVSDSRSFYDGSTTLGAAPSAGDVTMTQEATSYSGTTEEFSTESTDTYDEYGRVTSATDADGNKTTTAYTPATGAEPTSVTVTDPMSLVTTTTYDPARDLPLTVTNPAGWVTTETYDALGRLTAVWTPGHATSGPADKTFSYTVSATEPSTVTTETINSTGTYQASIALYDSLGRPIETQTETADGNRDITDTYYDSDGWQLVTSSPYYATGAPSGTLVAAPDDEVPQQTGYTYDGDGRVLREITYSYATELWETDYAYGGDYTSVTPPAGGTATTTYTNGEGQTSYIYQYHSGTAPANPPAPGSGSESGATGWDQTAYTYTPAEQLATVTDSAGDTWKYGYDLAGDRTSDSDPDSGISTSTYDNDGNQLTITDARDKTISYTYDADGRRTAEYDTTGGASETDADELASWKYDSLAKGQPTSSTTYVGGTGGSAYTEAVTGYNSYGLPTGSSVSVPTGPLVGTYKQLLYYSSYADVESSYYDYAAGGLPGETVDIGYDDADDPISLGSSLWPYVAELSYTELDQPEEYALGTTTDPAWVLNDWDLSTDRLDSTGVQAGSSPVTVDNVTYGYDNAGDITSEDDNPAGGPAQDQCFSYDYLGRLTQAWSQGSTSCSAGPSQSAEAAAAAPYWEQYTYNTQNDMTQEVSTPASGQATTDTNAFPATTGADGPHAIASQQASGPSGTTSTTYGYDQDGNTTSITGPSGTDSLAWNDAGQLSSVSSGGSTIASYIYDASGDLLLQTDGDVTTLYLPDEQITATTGSSGTTFSGVRYYTINGVTIAARTSAGDVQYLIGDQQGTATTAIDYETLAVTRRYYDPFGNAVGSAPSSWPGTQGFVGGTTDPVTGLTNLGLREYNPATASFISTDPLIDPYDPQDLNAYAYASDSPVTESDPTGAAPGGTPWIQGGNCMGSLDYCEHHGGGSGGDGSGGSGSGGSGNSGGYNDGRTNPWTPYTGPTNATDFELFLNPPPTVVRSPRAIAPHQASNGGFGSACGRFDYAPQCSTGFNQAVAAAHRESGGGNQLIAIWHGIVDAKNFVLHHLPSGTLGWCASGLADLGLALAGSFCYGLSYNSETEGFQLGSWESAGTGTGVPSVGFLIGPMWSNADEIHDLGGEFGGGGGSGELANVTAGADVMTGTSSSNRQIVTVHVGLGGSIDLPLVEAGFEIHGLMTNTWTQTWVGFHL